MYWLLDWIIGQAKGACLTMPTSQKCILAVYKTFVMHLIIREDKNTLELVYLQANFVLYRSVGSVKTDRNYNYFIQ